MIELKTRSTKCERYEAGGGNLCNIPPVIIAAAIGAAGSYLSAQKQAGAVADANDQNAANYQQSLEANKDVGQKVWTGQQNPYVFGQAWDPSMPAVNPQALGWNEAVGRSAARRGEAA